MKSQMIAIVAAVLVVGCGGSIHDAAVEGNIEAVKQHLAAGTDVNARGADGVTALLYAAAKGHKEIAELLIANGADVDAAKAKDGVTPLHVAAASGHTEVVELLIANGADVNAQGVGGMTPLTWAENVNQKETAALLRKHGGKTSSWFKAGDSIHIAAGAGHIEAVKQHLVDGANVNAKTNSGRTPLHSAAWGGHKEIAELLIAEGADVNAKRDNGKTPLDSAILFKQTKIADLLRKHGGKTAEELK